MTVSGSSATECDLVMKGGITSGVVYPRAATRLSGQYTFRRIGGSSAGAIAAVLAAAAEYQRRPKADPTLLAAAPEPEPEDGAGTGFARLHGLPDRLRTTLPLLFQPTERTRGVFDFLIAWIEPEWSTLKKIAVSVGRLVRWGLVPFVITTLLLLLPGFLVATVLLGGLDGGRLRPVLLSLLVWLIPSLIGGLLAAALVLGKGALTAINANGFGMVNGHASDDSLALTDWLTREINLTAGLPATGVPLTFGDLWGEDATQQFLAGFTSGEGADARFKRGARSIDWVTLDPLLDLRTMTTCLTHKLPRSFPFFDDSYLYCPTCLGEYFPSAVTRQLAEHSRTAFERDGDEVGRLCPVHAEDLRRLPFAPYLPVVIAARISLSFPVLISAIPLYFPDYFKLPGKRDVVQAWFSDGGITSNFPIQFFDSWMPTRPTFGITLGDLDDRYNTPEGDVTLPDATTRAKAIETPITNVVKFLVTMVETMQNWPDQLQMDAPGFKDRIVTVRTGAGEGGLNLKMSQTQIETLRDKGEKAGTKLLDYFDFPLHRWIRFRITMNAISVALAKFPGAWDDFTAKMPAAWTGSYDFTKAHETDTRAEADQLKGLATAWAGQHWPANADAPPRPEPELRFGTTTR